MLPGAFIILVGTHVSALPVESLSLSASVDAVAVGEYDATLVDLAGALADAAGYRHGCRGSATASPPGRSARSGGR